MKEEDKPFLPSGKPVISNRLPKAFSQPKHLTNKKSQDHQDSKAMNEFKNIKKLLSPLKIQSPKGTAFRRVIHKLACFPDISEKTLNMNFDVLVQSSIKIEEMITLSIIKSFCGFGTVRKSLHAPTFKLYATKEISVNTLPVRRKLLDVVKSWQRVQTRSKHFVEVYSSFWNSPEGCVTIVMKYMNGDSLFKLCDTIGAVPEKVLRQVSKSILNALYYYHKNIGPHGSVTRSHILFTKDGACKLGIGLSNKIIKEDLTV